MTNITLLLFICVSFLCGGCTKVKNSTSESFKFNLLSEPQDLDPAHSRGASGNYLFNNIYRGLVIYNNNQIKNENVKHCQWLKTTHLKCTLKSKKWSNGQPITATHYMNAFKRLFAKNSKSTQTEHLLNIIGAKDTVKGLKNFTDVGIKQDDDYNISFYLKQPDSNFLASLSNPAFAPVYSIAHFNHKDASQIVTNGPYKIRSWIKGKFIELEANNYYDLDASKRPPVKIYFLESDETALRLYETKKLNFLRRLLTSELKRFKNKADFFQVPIIRFDYIGLSGELLPYPKLRKALALSANYSELKTLYQAKGLPGCAGIPPQFQSRVHCHKFDLIEAKKIFNALPTEIKNKTWTLYFSKMGGKDIQKGMEWFQNQWRKNLGAKINLESAEQGMYLSKLSMKKTSLFRKGVGVDQATCLSALKTFTMGSHENYMAFSNPAYELVIKQLSNPHTTEKNQKKLCSQGIKNLLDSYQWIPLGEIHFSMLNDGQFTGFNINKLNQLDLTGLRRK